MDGLIVIIGFIAALVLLGLAAGTWGVDSHDYQLDDYHR